jgi:hypothetical protein
VTITTRTEHVVVADLLGFILAHEALFASQHSSLGSHTTDPVAFQAGKKRNTGSRQSFQGPNPSFQPLLLSKPQYLALGAPSMGRGAPGRGNGNGRGSYVPKCRICFK